MSASLDQPAPFYSDPGEDQRPMTADEHVDAILALFSADRVLTPDEIRTGQRLLVGMQAIAAMKGAQTQGDQQSGPMQDTAQDFGTQEGAEPAGPEPNPGVQNVQG